MRSLAWLRDNPWLSHINCAPKSHHFSATFCVAPRYLILERKFSRAFMFNSLWCAFMQSKIYTSTLKQVRWMGIIENAAKEMLCRIIIHLHLSLELMWHKWRIKKTHRGILSITQCDCDRLYASNVLIRRWNNKIIWPKKISCENIFSAYPKIKKMHYLHKLHCRALNNCVLILTHND